MFEGNALRPFPIEFPSPDPDADAAEIPIWNGEKFSVGQRQVPVLCYEVGQSGWTDELTAFHEEVAPDHYIDRASIAHTVGELRRFVDQEAPVVVEIGCSSGVMLETLRTEFPKAHLVGADYVRAPLEALASKLPGIPLLQFDLTMCPLPDKCADAVVLLNVLEHIERDDLALRHISRILKPNAVAVIEVPAGPNLFDVYDKVLLHHRRYGMQELLGKISDCGLQVVSKSHLGFFLYPAFWIAKKRGRRYLNKSADIQTEVVSRSIKMAGSQPLMHKLMAVEAHFRSYLYYPLGIRCLVTCRRS